MASLRRPRKMASPSAIDLRLGRWQDVLADVGMVDAVITDPPYSKRTHDGHDDGASLANGGVWDRSDGKQDRRRPRNEISYESWGAPEIHELISSWVPRCDGWVVALSDSDLCGLYRTYFEIYGRTGFQPLPCVIRGMTVRLAGDGPSSWAVYANVARPRSLSKWGTTPGAYVGGQGERAHIGGKPLWLMRALIRDYTKPGDLIVDPCAGAATTLIAAAMEGRRAIGAEQDPETHAKAMRRIAAGWTSDLFSQQPIGSDNEQAFAG
jgi:site-specific DNA-methyltransferase (adenine-specific)